MKLPTLLLLFYQTTFAQSPTLLEGHLVLPGFGAANENTGTNIKFTTITKLDNEGNRYQSGRYKGSYDFDLGAGTAIQPSTFSTFDLFIVKYSKTDELLWVKFLNSSSDVEQVTGMELDANQNLLISGSFRDEIDFDTGGAVFNMNTGQTGTNDRSGFVLKLNADGDFVWAKKLQAQVANTTMSIQVTVAVNSEVYLFGYLQGTWDADPSDAGTALQITPSNTNDAFIIKLDGNGNYLSNRVIVNPFNNDNITIAVDQSNVAFAFWNQIGNGSNSLGYRSKMSKLSLELNDVWSYTYFDPNSPAKLAVDAQNGAYFSNQNNLTKFDKATGAILWSKAIFGNIFIDKMDELVLIGSFTNSATDFDPDPNVVLTFPLEGFSTPYIKKFDSNGNLLWVRILGQTTGANNVITLTVNSDNSFWISGYFRTTIDIDPSANMQLFTNTNGSSYYADFIAKYCDCDTYKIQASKHSGDWDNATTWSCWRVPFTTDELTIKTNHIVNILTDFNALAKKITVERNGNINNSGVLCINCQ